MVRKTSKVRTPRLVLAFVSACMVVSGMCVSMKRRPGRHLVETDSFVQLSHGVPTQPMSDILLTVPSLYRRSSIYGALAGIDIALWDMKLRKLSARFISYLGKVRQRSKCMPGLAAIVLLMLQKLVRRSRVRAVKIRCYRRCGLVGFTIEARFGCREGQDCQRA